jgi:hypothetical protein
MSDTVDIFCRANIPIEDCREFLQEQLRIELVESIDVDWQLFKGEVGGIFIALYDELDYDDDYGIPFSQFRIAISFTRYAMSGPPHPKVEDCVAMALPIAHKLAERFGTAWTVVQNMSHVVKQVEAPSDAR